MQRKYDKQSQRSTQALKHVRYLSTASMWNMWAYKDKTSKHAKQVTRFKQFLSH